MIIAELTKKEYDTILRIMGNKAKEIHTWRAATKSDTRDDEYNEVMDALRALKNTKKE